MTKDQELPNTTENLLSTEEYHGLLPLIDKKIITTVELPVVEFLKLIDQEKESEKIQSSSIQLHSGKITCELDSPQKVSIRYAHEFVERDTAKTMIHQGIYTSLSLIKQYFGMEWFISAIAVQLADRYEMTELQAKALLYKLLGYSMDSTSRSHLYQLRQKIIKYKPLIVNFEDLILHPTGSDNYINELKTGIITLSKTPHPANKKYYSDPELDALPNHGQNVILQSASQIGEYIISYSCYECDFQHKIVFAADKQELPQMFHHGNQMKMILSR